MSVRAWGSPKKVGETCERRPGRSERKKEKKKKTRRITKMCQKGASLGGLEPPTFRLTAERANRLRHRDCLERSRCLRIQIELPRNTLLQQVQDQSFSWLHSTFFFQNFVAFKKISFSFDLLQIFRKDSWCPVLFFFFFFLGDTAIF